MLSKIAVIGLANSGKTTFINKMINDVNSFAPKISMSEYNDSSLEYSANIPVIRRKFSVVPSNTVRWDLEVMDYSGRILDTDATNGNSAEIYNFFLQSPVWFVILNGSVFEQFNCDNAVSKLRQNEAVHLNGIFNKYKEINASVPEIVFIISNSGKCSAKYTNDLLSSVISKAFEEVYSQLERPRIIKFNEKGRKTAGLALMSVLFENHSKDLLKLKLDAEKEFRKVNEELMAKVNELKEKLKIEEKKARMFRKEDKIEAFKQQIADYEAEIADNTVKKKTDDMALKHIGTAINRLLVYTKNETVYGYDNLQYPADTSLEEVVQEKEKKWENVASFASCVLILLLLILFFVFAEDPLGAVGATIVFIIVAALFPNPIVFVIGLVFIIVMIFQAIGWIGVLITVVSFFLMGIMMSLGESMDKAEYSKKPKIWKFKNQLTDSFDKIAKE